MKPGDMHQIPDPDDNRGHLMLAGVMFAAGLLLACAVISALALVLW